jgi:Do/DeqQ family serine protease
MFAMATHAPPLNWKKRSWSNFAGTLMLVCCLGQFSVGNAQTRENDVVRAVRKVSPAVVNISSEYEIRKNSSPFSQYGMDPMLERFFREFFAPELERRERRTSLGSGVVIDGERGLVLTNTHVIEKASTIGVTLNDQHEFSATIVGMDPDSDLAVLKLDAQQVLPSIAMGDSDDVMIGESVIAIGNPFGFSHTVTTGVISAVKRSIKTAERVFHEFIQTDASINPGNSGGPLLNIDGELIGINTAIYAEGQGIGFAIPINRAKRIISDLIAYGEVVPAWIGVTVQPVDAGLAQYLGLEGPGGVLVTQVEPQSPAQKAGLQEGDVIVSIDGTGTVDETAYQLKLNDISVDQSISVTLNRNGAQLRLPLKTALFPLERALDLADRQLGIRVADLSDQARARYGLTSRDGVLIVKLRRGSHLDRIGVRPGDMVRKIDEAPVSDVETFKAAVVKYRNKPAVVLFIERDGTIYHINTPMKDDT